VFHGTHELDQPASRDSQRHRRSVGIYMADQSTPPPDPGWRWPGL